MGRMLYFISGATTVSKADLPGLGLAHLATGEHGISTVNVSRGPDGERGVVFSPNAPGSAGALGYHHEAQDWTRFAESAVWCGWYRDGKPGPQDLARTKQYEGDAVPLGDGAAWLVPVITICNQGTWLPRRMTYDGAKYVDGDVVPELRDIFERACACFEQIKDGFGSGADFVVQGIPEMAADALGLNYRVGRFEVGALGLFDTESVYRVASALTGIARLQAALEKEEKKTLPVSA